MWFQREKCYLNVIYDIGMTNRFDIRQWLEAAKSGLLMTVKRGLLKLGPTMWS